MLPQGGIDPEEIETFKNKRVYQFAADVGGSLLALAVGVLINTINTILGLEPGILGPVTGTKKVWGHLVSVLNS